MKPTAVVLTRCSDRPGLVARVSEFIYQHNGNIVHVDYYTDVESGQLFMRMEWDLQRFDIERDQTVAAFASLADTLQMEWQLYFSDTPQRIAIMVSKYSHCLNDLLWRAAEGELRGEVAIVISNHPDLEPVVRRYNIPFHLFPVNKENKQEVERKELELLAANRIDLVVLARYMQILSPTIVDRYPQRIINIHHSFLPAFSGARAYHRAYDRGVKLIGSTSLYVTTQLDEGPIIEQDVVRVSHRDTVEGLIRKGRDLERVVLARAVRLHLDHRIMLSGTKTVVFD